MYAKFQVGDAAMHMHSQTGDTTPIAEARFETAYPRQWWYRLEGERRWYPEGHLWNVADWQAYQADQTETQCKHEARERAMLNPSPPPEWRDYVTALTVPRYTFQVRDYCRVFVAHVDYYYADIPAHLYKEYWSCFGVQS